MTTATTEGRRLRLAVEGVDGILVDPLPAKRGKYLTEKFLAIAVGQLTGAPAEAIFAEALGADNYARISGDNVRTFDPAGIYVATVPPSGIPFVEEGVEPAEDGERFTIVPSDEDGLPLRSEEVDALCLCAFYWQTVVGIEAVRVFLEGGEGTEASLKAFRLLLTRTALSTQVGSSSRVSASSMQEALSGVTPGTESSSKPAAQPAAVRLPAHKRSIRQGSAFRRG